MAKFQKKDICALDYLPGTIATAYKGSVTSLVAKDFCMFFDEREVLLKGAVLALPPGEFEAFLLAAGIAIGRVSLEAGSFEFRVPAEAIERADNLQVDIVDRGKHIGTFLLKQETGHGYFISAVELSRELEGVNLSALNEALNEKPGLRERGEEIVAALISTKKEWRILSDSLNRFAGDLFWYSRAAFLMWYPVLARFLVVAAQRALLAERGKAVGNLLRLVLLTVDHESDHERRRDCAAAWFGEVVNGELDFSLRRRECLAVLEKTVSLVPPDRFVAFARGVLWSFRRRISSVPTISDGFCRSLETVGGQGARDCGTWFRSRVDVLLANLSEAERSLAGAEGLPSVGPLLEALRGVDPALFDGAALVRCVVGVIQEGLDRTDADTRNACLRDFIALGSGLDQDGIRALVLGVVRLFADMAGSGNGEGARALLDVLGDAGAERERVLLSGDMVTAVVNSDAAALNDRFDALLSSVHLPAPGITGFSEETWAELSEPAHLERLGALLDALAAGGGRLPRTLLFLVARLYVVGAFVPDDRLFQRKVSSILNSQGAARDYLLHYLLLKKLPVFFNEVGASGRIRDLSTELDAGGRDSVLYFLRKQVHVNASARNVGLVRSVMDSWVTGNRELLRDAVPEEILSQTDEGVFARYAEIARGLASGLDDGHVAEDVSMTILSADAERLRGALDSVKGDADLKGKIQLLLELHRELAAKYGAQGAGGQDAGDASLENLNRQVERLRELREVVLDPGESAAEESFYFKRHIAFGIPSVIGSYRERKFDAFKEIQTVEERVRVLLEGAVAEIDDAAEPDLRRFAVWVGALTATMELLEQHGLGNPHVKELVSVLETNELRCSQVVDLLRMWQRELTWTVELLYRRFHVPLGAIIPLYSPGELPPKLRAIPRDQPGFSDKAADVIIRDVVHAVAGLEEADRLLNAMIKALERWCASSGDLVLEGEGCADGTRDGVVSLEELNTETAISMAPLLGAKAANLVRLREAGLLVPAGVVITADRCCHGDGPVSREHFLPSVREGVRILENRTGKRLGGRVAPLLLSVRSGSYISMPGILETVLFCGMNGDIVEEMVADAGDAWGPWDSYRRFLEHYGAVVLGIEHEDFLGIMAGMMEAEAVESVQGLRPGAMRELVARYLREIASRGVGIPDDPYEQVAESALAICLSWWGDRARAFRGAMNVSPHWGTSVTLMEMIPGNSPSAGASVFFTRLPETLESGVYGETRRRGTGDDLVYGKATNQPLAAMQAADGESLESMDPGLFRLHRETAALVERAMGGLPQEVEAVYRDGAMYVLQTKRMEFSGAMTDQFHEICRMESSIVGRGIGVHGGALSGVVTFAPSPNAIRGLRASGADTVILLRRETSTDDVALLPEVDAILTSLGGATSHAAILAQKFGITAVVGCTDMRFTEEDGETAAIIGGHRVTEGMPLSLDGSTGIVYSGVCEFTFRSSRSASKT